MVSEPINQRKAVRGNIMRRVAKYYLLWIFVFLALATLIYAFYLVILGMDYSMDELPNNIETNEENIHEDSEAIETEQEKEPEIVKINFQPTIDTWAASVGGNKSVLIYDFEREEVVGSYNPAENYNTASLYKLFVVYEGYRRINSGEWDKDMMVGSTGYSVLKCLDLAIRESYSPCAEVIWAMIGHDNLDKIIENDFNITDSDISRLISNPGDILKILKIFYYHVDLGDGELISLMKDSFLNQPATTYNWRQGLPSGFKKANVYNKVGWDWNGEYWNIYHDAAIVEFPEENRHFAVVVMTNRVSFKDITRLGNMIEDAFLQTKLVSTEEL